jgi:hypothetical protein
VCGCYSCKIGSVKERLWHRGRGDGVSSRRPIGLPDIEMEEEPHRAVTGRAAIDRALQIGVSTEIWRVDRVPCNLQHENGCPRSGLSDLG